MIRPGADFQSRIEESIATHAAHRKELQATRDLAAVTQDGAAALMINAGLLMDFDSGGGRRGRRRPVAHGAHLYAASEFPNTAEQRRPMRGFSPPPEWLSLPTFDIGGDKLLPISAPARTRIRPWVGVPCGSRWIGRVCCVGSYGSDRCGGGPLHVMFPMVSEVA